jgi:hypothetical protein
MSITIGSNSITGLSAGGLPSSVITNALMASSSVGPANMPTGSIIQVQGTTLTTTFSCAPNGTATALTGLSVSITPQFSTSKILLMGHICYSSESTTYGGYITRNGTAISLGNSASGQQQVSWGMSYIPNNDGNESYTIYYQIYDSPGTTSACTYQVMLQNDNTQTIYINRSPSDAGAPTGKRSTSTIVAMEIR